MAKVKIEHANPRIAGEHELDLGYFTNRELHLIKKETGVRAGELVDAFQAGDNDLLIVLAFVALQRNGRLDVPIDALWEMEAGTITLDLSDEEEDASPPESAPVASESDGGPTPSSSETSSSAGEASPGAIPLRATGSPG